MAVTTSDYEAREAAESERALLGALLLDSTTAWPQVRESIAQADFARADHRAIFGAIASLISDGIWPDGAIAIDRLYELGQLDVAGGREYIAELITETSSAASAGAYAKIVRRRSGREKVVELASRLEARARSESTEDAATFAQAELEKLRRQYAETAEALKVTPVAAWANAPAPQPREWVLEGMIPAGRVTSLFGNGGLGKTLLALQIGMHVSMGRPLFDVGVTGGSVLGIFCEDEEAELNRRLRAACAAERIELSDVDRFYALSRDGADSMLCTFEHDHIKPTSFYAQLEATVASLKPHLVILDTAADLFAGDFLSTPHVRQFLKVALGGLCVRHGCAVLLLAHPSAAAISSGEGGGFSTAWSNSVRSRLYLSRPKPPEEGSDEPIDIHDRRVLEVKKSNYAAGDVKLPLVYQAGVLVPDPEPLGMGPSSPRTKTARVALATLDFIRHKDPLVAGFRDLFDTLQLSGVIPQGPYEERRKPLFRALRQLVADGIVVETKTPRGYRLNAELR